MSNTNDFVPFCATDTGTNLLSQAAYLVAADRPIGNQPGVASSNLVNKALRQPTYVASQIAQYISNQANVSTLDNATPAQFLSQIMAAFQPLAPVVETLLSGTSTWNATVFFFIASGNATSGATYTNNGVTYTVSSTISSGIVLQTTGNGAPTAGGVLTKTGGTGDSTITFYAYRAPAFIKIRAVGGGGGGSGGGAGSTSGGNGGDTTFGTSLIVAGGGTGGVFGTGSYSPGGSATLGSGPVGIALAGSPGSGSAYLSGGIQMMTGGGGVTPFGGAGSPGGYNVVGSDAVANSGSGGAGGGAGGASTAEENGVGGGAGGYIDGYIFAPNFSYTYSIGAGGTHGNAGNEAGGAGGSGLIILESHFQ